MTVSLKMSQFPHYTGGTPNNLLFPVVDTSTYLNNSINYSDLVNDLNLSLSGANNNYYTTGATLNGTVISFDRNDTLSAYTVNLSSVIGGGTNYANILIVDPNGNDSTGAKGDITKPYLTIEAAVAAATSGCTVIINPGFYTVNTNIAKDGIAYYFYDGTNTTKTTANPLFDYSLIATTSDITINGGGIFNCTYGFFKRTNNVNIINNILLSFKKVTVTNANAITNDGSSIKKIKVNGDITCSGGIGYSSYGVYCEYCELNGNYLGTSSSNNIFLVNYAPDYYDSINKLNINSYNTSSGWAIYLYGGKNSITGNLIATGSLLTANESLTTMNGNIVGTIYGATDSSHPSLIFNGAFDGVCHVPANGFFTFNLTDNVIYLPWARGGSPSFENSGGFLTINGSIYQGNYPVERVLLTSNAATSKTHIYANIRATYLAGNLYVISDGQVFDNSNIFTYNASTAGIDISGGEYIFTGHFQNSAPTSNITISAGKFYLNGGTLITNGTNCINVTNNATFKHSGGILNCTTNCITTAISKTLTIRNYNNYYTNYERGGAGTYTETITGGGTEIVDINVD